MSKTSAFASAVSNNGHQTENKVTDTAEIEPDVAQTIEKIAKGNTPLVWDFIQSVADDGVFAVKVALANATKATVTVRPVQDRFESVMAALFGAHDLWLGLLAILSENIFLFTEKGRLIDVADQKNETKEHVDFIRSLGIFHTDAALNGKIHFQVGKRIFNTQLSKNFTPGWYRFGVSKSRLITRYCSPAKQCQYDAMSFLLAGAPMFIDCHVVNFRSGTGSWSYAHNFANILRKQVDDFKAGKVTIEDLIADRKDRLVKGMENRRTRFLRSLDADSSEDPQLGNNTESSGTDTGNDSVAVKTAPVTIAGVTTEMTVEQIVALTGVKLDLWQPGRALAVMSNRDFSEIRNQGDLNYYFNHVPGIKFTQHLSRH